MFPVSTRKLTAALVLAAATFAPTASARPVEGFLPSQATGADAGALDHARVVTVTADRGFDWGDAAIGAGGALVLSIAALSGAAAIRNGRTSGAHT
jgi:hypothetical protein